MPITPGVASPTIVPTVATAPGMPVTSTTPAQEALAATTVLDTQEIVPAAAETEHELSLPETILPIHPSTNENQLGASYLNNHIHQVVPNTNASLCSSDSDAHKDLISLLDEKLNHKLYSTFKEMFNNTNLDSVSELSSEVQSYNIEIAKFIQEINRKNGIILNYTVLEISEVPHCAETFQVLARSNAQPEVQPTQVPVLCPAEMPNFSVPLPPVNENISQQQAEISRLTQVAQQWSTEAPCQYNQAPTHYNQDRITTNAGRGSSI